MKNNVPVVPGTPGPVSDPEHAHAFVEEYGFPVIIKALKPDLQQLMVRLLWVEEDVECE
jgi:pyruvate carboxylase